MSEAARREKAEAAYVGGSMSLRELGKEMGISVSTLGKWSKAGEWKKKREKIAARALKKAATRAVNQKAKELAKLLEASDELESALLMAARAFQRNIAKDKQGLILTDGKFRAGNLSSIAGAIGRQAETRMMISGVMTAADREKIALMRRKQTLEEKKEKEARKENAGVAVQMDDETKGLAK